MIINDLWMTLLEYANEKIQQSWKFAHAPYAKFESIYLRNPLRQHISANKTFNEMVNLAHSDQKNTLSSSNTKL